MSGRERNAFNEYGRLRTVAVKHPREALLAVDLRATDVV